MTNERPIYFSEVAEFLKKNRRKIALFAIGCFLVTLVSLLVVMKPTYRAEATFRKAREQSEEITSVESILKSIRAFSEDSSAHAVMLSRTLLGRVVEELGLQVVPAKRGRLKKLVSRKGKEETLFGPVAFAGEEGFDFFLMNLSDGQFAVLDAKKKEVAAGEVGIPFEVGDASLTVRRLNLGKKPVRFRLLPKRAAIGLLSKQVTIKSSRLDPNILQLKCDHSVRLLSIGILDSLMAQFQGFLKDEHECLAREQIAYLQKRQRELGSEFDQALEAHVAYMQDALGVEGFLGLSQEIEMLSEPKELYTSKRHQLDLDAKKWKEESFAVAAEHPWKEGLQKRDELDWQQAKILPTGAPTEIFGGIDLETANKIYIGYSLDRDQLNTQIDQLKAYREMIRESDFELGALSSILSDPVSQKLIEKGHELSLKLADKGAFTDKERQLMKDALQKQKAFIGEHLAKQGDLLTTKRDVLEDKMNMLQEAALQLIAREKGIIDDKLGELAKQMGELPEKWRLESRLKMKKELIMQIIEGLTQLSESKVVGHHLFHIESKPIDPADAPLKMKNPHLFAFSSMGGALGAFFLFVVLLIRAVYRGLPISKSYLQDQGIPFLEWDKKTLKRIALFLGEGEEVALIGRPCASQLKSLIGEGTTLHECKNGPDSVEALGFLQNCDRFILFINEEKVDTLEPYPKDKVLCVLTR